MIWLIAFLFKGASTAFCGTSLIPYSLEVLPGGGTVLGCARPACFGWDSSTGGHAAEDHSFIEQRGYRDGFSRADPDQRQPFMPTVPQTATCLPASSCGPGQWGSGFVPGQQGAAASLMCCSNPALAQAEDLGVATLSPGTIAYGGERPSDGPTTHFDYLRNIRQITMPDGQIQYDVEMGRMPCQEPQPMIPAIVAQQVIILMHDLTEKQMDELKLNDWIMTPSQNVSFVQSNMVKSWLHRMPEVMAEFLILSTEEGKSVKLTRRHLIVRADCEVPKETKTVPAEDIQVGDCLLEMKGTNLVPVSVSSIKSVWQQGIYAPQTDTGNLIVNGFAVSCFSEVSDSILTRNLYESVVQCDEEGDCSVSDSRASLLFALARFVIPGSKF